VVRGSWCWWAEGPTSPRSVHHTREPSTSRSAHTPDDVPENTSVCIEDCCALVHSEVLGCLCVSACLCVAKNAHGDKADKQARELRMKASAYAAVRDDGRRVGAAGIVCGPAELATRAVDAV
jgi:hypothetical protein